MPASSDGDTDDHAGENIQPHGAHDHDRVLRAPSLYNQARLDGSDQHGFWARRCEQLAAPLFSTRAHGRMAES